MRLRHEHWARTNVVEYGFSYQLIPLKHLSLSLSILSYFFLVWLNTTKKGSEHLYGISFRIYDVSSLSSLSSSIKILVFSLSLSLSLSLFHHGTLLRFRFYSTQHSLFISFSCSDSLRFCIHKPSWITLNFFLGVQLTSATHSYPATPCVALTRPQSPSSPVVCLEHFLSLFHVFSLSLPLVLSLFVHKI